MVNTFHGTYFDGKTSKAYEVTFEVREEVLSIRGESVHLDLDIGHCTLETALGSTCRTLYTPEGGRLDTIEQDAFSALERRQGSTRRYQVVHLLESHWIAALASVVITVLLILASSIWGIPYLAKVAAFSIPKKAVDTFGTGVLDRADRFFFDPSELDEKEHKRIRSLVEKFVLESGAPEPRSLVFRKSSFGPNAFAFPGRTVVLTDELDSFVEKDGELLGVVAHELAHLEQRHAMRTLLQGTGVFVLVSVLLGDVTSITAVAGTLPALLLKSRYSRKFEQEADAIASQWMLDTGNGVEPMIAFLTRLEKEDLGREGPEFLATHPSLEKRISYLRALQKKIDDHQRAP